MSDPHRPGQPDWQGTEPAYGYPPYTDPAYAGQTPMYGYPPVYAPTPTGQIPQQYRGQGPPPSGGGDEPPPPEPPRSPRWLWLLAGAAVLLVVGLVIALVMVNDSANKSTPASQSPSTPTTKAGTPAPPTPPTTTRPAPRPPPTAAPPTTGAPGETTNPNATESVIYKVTGQGRAISIIYIDTDTVMQTEFNVQLPWSKEVSLTSSASRAASVTVANVGEEVTCSVTVNGTQVSERTGSILTVCTPAR
jgi:cytoskeletal protein RodZ